MSSSKRIRWFIAIVWAAVALVLITAAWIPAGVVILLSLSFLFLTKLKMDRVGQLIVVLLFAALIYVLQFVFFKADETQDVLITVGYSGAMWSLVVAAFRRNVKNAVAGEVVDGMLLMTAYLLLGFGSQTNIYIWVVSIGVLLILLANTNVSIWRSRMQRKERSIGAMVVLLSVTTVVTLFFIYTIPIAYRWTMNRYFDAASFSTTGFHPALELGSVGKMLQSNEVVLRVYAQPSNLRHMRGAVYNTYGKTYWTLSIDTTSKQQQGSGASYLSQANTLDSIKRVRVIPSTSTSNYFVPLGAQKFHAAASVNVNQLGIVHAVLGEDTGRYSFVAPTISMAGSLDVTGPVESDLEVPQRIQKTLKRFAYETTRNFQHSAQKLSALMRALHKNNQYALSFDRNPNRDEVVDFLFYNKKGHCEYFASSFALLARTVGVPTRVVGGYYLREYNSIGDYYIVREKHAHTWVEAWINKKWVTIDPTPAGDLPETSSVGTALWDSFVVAIGRFFSYLGALPQWIIPASIGGLLIIWILIRVFRKRLPKQLDSQQALVYNEPHQMFVVLQKQMAPIVVKKAHESIESWVNRLEGTSPRIVAARKWALDYAAWRYGEGRDMDKLAKGFAKWKELK